MATQEDRLTTLERGFASFQKERIGLVEGRLSAIEQRLESMEGTLREHTKQFDHVGTLLNQILERLPK